MSCSCKAWGRVLNQRSNRGGLSLSVSLLVLVGLAALGVLPPALADDPAPKSVPESVGSAIRLLLMDKGAGLSLRALEHFYSARDYRPALTGPQGPLPEALAVVEAMAASGREGLRPGDYRPWLSEILKRPLSVSTRSWLDVLLTDSLLRYARDLHSGRRDPRDIDPDWLIPYHPLDAVLWLAQALRDRNLDSALKQLPPPHPHYAALRLALADYREKARAGDWPQIPDGPLLRAGDVDPRVTLLARRLGREGEYAGPVPIGDATYNAELEAALRGFQARNGLKIDGILGPETRAALNVSPSERVEQIRTNMERWRWLPRDLSERYILVNLGGFELWLYDGGEMVFRTRVIAGRSDRQSPSFTTQVLGVQVNPEWVVPRRIAVNDLLPQQRRRPRYLGDKGIHVFRTEGNRQIEVLPQEVDWSRPYRMGYFPFVLRQEPGPQNSLGRLKLLMPNPYSIYLHDTPSKALFDKHQRDFSSGCIRVQNPVRLASLLLGSADPDEAVQRVDDLIDSGDTLSLRLPRPVPVYLLYLTAWVDERGEVQFRSDIYGRD
jgi:murein L,D-transpeptidase YcbB/YkuD